MLKNYLLIAYRNLSRNKGYSSINIGGLAIGMAVAIMLALWVNDELSFNKQAKNYDRIAQVYQHVKFDAVKSTYNVMPIPLADVLRTKYPEFEKVALSKWESVGLKTGDKILRRTGSFVQADFPDMMSVEILSGSSSLKDMNSVLLSQTLAKNLFGDTEPLNQLLTLDNKHTVKVTGVYRDFARNSSFNELTFLGSWDFFVTMKDMPASALGDWDSNSYGIYAQIKEGVGLTQTSAKIRDIRVKMENPPNYRPEFFLFPMSRWHLYDDFYDGKNIGGSITFVWLFGTIGLFVLLLACINFMNLSTARSERRAREVGIRKAIGSVRRQLIFQFLTESLLVTFISFIVAVVLVQLSLPAFNSLSQKDISIPWSMPIFWISCLGFSLLTGIVAGSYPALYLSSFNPIKVLKGTFRAGRFAALPRRVLVVLQFTISVALIIGTIIVFSQINYAKSRPMGYTHKDLIELKLNTREMLKQFRPMRDELLKTGAVAEVTAASSPITEEYGGTTAISWPGKVRGTSPLLISNYVTTDYGKAFDWKIQTGRTFSQEFKLDSTAMILNESAVKLMALKNPVGETIRWNDKDYHVIGIVKNMVRESPFSPVKPGFYVLGKYEFAVMDIRLNGKQSISSELAAVEKVFKQFNPNSPFDFNFVSSDFGEKFKSMELIGKLATVFSVLAILISCLGLFGMASFMAEQRTREIGVRKVLGASLFNVWRLLSREFVLLVILSFIIACPIMWYLMKNWLQNYEYRTNLSLWIFAGAGIGAVTITLLTVSYQAIRAGLTNPVKSLRTE